MAVRTVRTRTRLRRITWTGALVAVAVTGTTLLSPAVAGAAVHDGRTTHSATRKALDDAVAEGVPGALAQVRDRAGVWNGAAGVADRTTGRERGAQDRYRIGSITKTFVATVLLQLEAEGRIDLDDSVESVLPGVVRGNGNDGRAITVRQLLNHTSGLYSYTADPEFGAKIFGEGFFEHRYDTWTPRQLVAIGLAHRPDFEPGTGWNYSNTNYVLAGMIVEKVTGRSYGTEIERRILRPLKLRATSVPITDPTMPNPAGRAYEKFSAAPDAEIHDVTELNPTIAGAAGGMISHSADLNRFLGALLGGKLLPKAQLKEMLTTVSTGQTDDLRYGLGLMEQKLSCDKTLWGHGGGIHGSSSMAIATRDGGHSLAMNYNAGWVGDTDKAVEAEFC
ncbi:serine hydrolase domain-containing protein [Streptomyces sp. NPDC087850]|uniref:serine hydrolase domain-containing protein n=1 Tax=Streptomyces sp. NPDC087850 TaxID=3365809 RepID=UPI003827C8C2